MKQVQMTPTLIKSCGRNGTGYTVETVRGQRSTGPGVSWSPRSAGGTCYTTTTAVYTSAANWFLAGRGSRIVADPDITPPVC